MIQSDCTVLSARWISPRYRLLELKEETISRTAQPGQFVMIRASDRTSPLLPRPLAIFDTDPTRKSFRLLFVPVGQGTEILSEYSGGSLRVTGPLGRPFQLVPNAIRHIAIGGGTGIAALYSLARASAKPLRESGKSMEFLIGARDTAGLLNEELRERLQEHGAQVFESTDDGSRGFHGTVADLLQFRLEDTESSGDNPQTALYVAGPVPLMRAVSDIAKERNIRCQLSLENRMACGVGVCRGCVCNAKTPHPETGLFRRTVCTDGPVFDMDEIEF